MSLIPTFTPISHSPNPIHIDQKLHTHQSHTFTNLTSHTLTLTHSYTRQVTPQKHTHPHPSHTLTQVTPSPKAHTHPSHTLTQVLPAFDFIDVLCDLPCHLPGPEDVSVVRVALQSGLDQLVQQQGVLEDPLNWLYQQRLQIPCLGL